LDKAREEVVHLFCLSQNLEKIENLFVMLLGVWAEDRKFLCIVGDHK